MSKVATSSFDSVCSRLPKSWVNAFLVLVLLFAFFPIKFTFLPIDSARIFYLLFFLAIPFARILELPIKPLIVAALTFLVSVVAALLNLSDEFSMIRICAEFLVRYFVIMNILAAIVYRIVGDDWQRLLRIIISVFIVQAFFILTMLLLPSFQGVMLSILKSDAKGLGEEGFWRLRQVGVTGWAAYDMAITMLCPIFMMSGLVGGLSSWRSKFKFTLMFSIILAAALVSGRSTFVGLAILICMSIIMFGRQFNRVGYFYLKSLSLLALAVGIFASWLAANSSAAEVKFFINWAFEIILNFASGSAETESTNELSKMYFMPADRTLFLGDGRYIASDGGFYGATDVGFLRLILYFGIFGAICFYSFFMLFFYFMVKKLAVLSVVMAFYVAAYGAFLFLMNIKASVFVDVIPALSSLFFLYFYVARLGKNHVSLGGAPA